MFGSLRTFFNKISFFCLLLAVTSSYAQNDNEAKGIELFEDGEFKLALPIFSDLQKLYPDDNKLNYYYAVCLLETNNKEANPAQILNDLKASELPSNYFYYLGKANQEQENWQLAVNAYREYMKIAPSKTIKKLKLQESLDICRQKALLKKKEVVQEVPKEPVRTDIKELQDALHAEVASKEKEEETQVIKIEITEEEIPEEKTSEDEIFKKDTSRNNEEPATINFEEPTPDTIQSNTEHIEVIEVDSMATEEPIEEIQEEKQSDTIVAVETQSSYTDTINFQINNAITYRRLSQFKTEEGKKAFTEIKSLQDDFNESSKKMTDLRAQYATATDSQSKEEIAGKILVLEPELLRLRRELDSANFNTRKFESAYWSSATQEQIDQLNQENSAVIEWLTKPQQTDQVSDVFSIRTATKHKDKSDSKSDDKAEEDQQERGLVYKIQIGAYSRGLPTYVKRLYEKLSIIRKIDNYKDEKGVVVYTTGHLKSYQDALRLQKQVRLEGVKDAFVAAYNDGKRISLKEARKLSGE
ncbi:hypothetical protein EYV94_08840 [Puteibacter caeruleilacunae]|nr:hypothetical protein EYV94_08840 [Puteibacter caeruleilacunae]